MSQGNTSVQWRLELRAASRKWLSQQGRAGAQAAQPTMHTYNFKMYTARRVGPDGEKNISSEGESVGKSHTTRRGNSYHKNICSNTQTACQTSLLTTVGHLGSR